MLPVSCQGWNETKDDLLNNSYEKRLLRVISYIHDNPAGDLSLDTLADVAAMSRFHWHRVFSAMMGEDGGAGDARDQDASGGLLACSKRLAGR